MASHKRKRGMRALRRDNPSHLCALCGHRGSIGHHIRWQHPGFTYKQYVETYYKKFCQECGQQIPYEPKRAQYSIVTCCSAKCARSQQGKTLGQRTGPSAGSWRGGRFAVASGYVFLNISGLSGNDRTLALAMNAGKRDHFGKNYIQEHRLVMARHLMRPLLRTEQVHHRNAKRGDNHINNLELRVSNHGTGASAGALVCPHCGKSYA